MAGHVFLCFRSGGRISKEEANGLIYKSRKQKPSKEETFSSLVRKVVSASEAWSQGEK